MLNKIFMCLCASLVLAGVAPRQAQARVAPKEATCHLKSSNRMFANTNPRKTATPIIKNQTATDQIRRT